MKECKSTKMSLLESLLESLDGSVLEKLKFRKRGALKDAMLSDEPTVKVTEVKSEDVPVEKLPEEVKEKIKSLSKMEGDSVWDEEGEDEENVWDKEDNDEKEDTLKRLFD